MTSTKMHKWFPTAARDEDKKYLILHTLMDNCSKFIAEVSQLAVDGERKFLVDVI